MERAKHGLERVGEHRRRLALRRVVRAEEHGLGELDEPVAEIVPEEAVERERRVVEPVGVEPRVRRVDRQIEAREDPAVRERRRHRHRAIERDAGEVLRHEARRVPHLVGEVSVPLDALRRERDPLEMASAWSVA